MKIFLIILSSGLTLSFSSCYYDKGDLLYPQNGTGCDTTAVSYNRDVMPLLSNRCYTCHIGATAGGGIVLGTYAEDKVVALNGKLYGAVNHSPGFSQMPTGGTKLNTCQLATVKKWIDAGSPNN